MNDVTIRVLIVDDQRTFAEALRSAVQQLDDIAVVGVAEDGRQAVGMADELAPHVVLMDVEMPAMDGIEATKQIKRARPEAQVVILSTYRNDALLARALTAGAAGYLSKDTALPEVAAAIRSAAAGEPLVDEAVAQGVLARFSSASDTEMASARLVERLTPREIEILQLMADGTPSDRIASTLFMSPHTLRTHVAHILRKLEVHSRMEALALAVRHGKVVIPKGRDTPRDRRPPR